MRQNRLSGLAESPIRVAAPPMFDANVSDIMNGKGETESSDATTNVIGATSRMVVTLSRKAERTAVATTRRIIVF